MRGGLSAIQQTLTPEAATVLSHSISEAGRRNHGQTTPLHVAATLLASPTGFLRQACIRSHPNSSHPLQCRALELCFSVALERLPTSQTGGGGSGTEPPISNALMAALKRAQAHQRRGCPEQQQQPLLAVKVELEQLIISILDDPSVSRVMREASFSSPAVKAAIEQVVSAQPNSGNGGAGPRIGVGFRPGPGHGPGPSPPGAALPRNLYLNPKLQQQQQQQLQGKGDDVKKVIDILLKPRKRNPILVGESGPEDVVKEIIRRIEKDEIRDEILKGVEVISAEKELGSDRAQMVAKLKEMVALIERKMVVNSKGGNGVIVDLGDLKWLVDQTSNQGISETAQMVVCEMGKILNKFGEGSKLWYMGIATCETYLRCKVYHSSMEDEWDLHVVSIVAKPPISGIFPRLGSNGGILSSSVECLSPMKSFSMHTPSLSGRMFENLDPSKKFSCCPQCTEKYEEELAKVVAGQTEKPSSEVKSDANQQSLPQWLQTAKRNTSDIIQNKEQDVSSRQKTQELQKKWGESCLRLHPSFHNMGSERITPSPLSMTGLYNPQLLARQPIQPKSQQPPRVLGDRLQLKLSSPVIHQLNAEKPASKPGSPVRTELVLGPTKISSGTDSDCVQKGLKDFLGCISSESTDKPFTAIPEDVDSYKRLLKGLIGKVWWQTDAASAVAAAVTQCRLGNGKRRVGGSKGDIWLLFSGPDRTGKKKMAAALSDLVCGISPVIISLGCRREDETDLNFRGKTVINRIVEAVRRNPFSVVMLQDIDEADLLVRGGIKRAMERGRISDSHGREISLGNVIFIVTSNWVPDQLRSLSDGVVTLSEEKMTSLASGGWQLRISISEKPTSTTKRSPSWMNDDDQDRVVKQRKDEAGAGLAFDLNQMADIDDDRLDNSYNSSDITVEHEEENKGSPTTSSAAPKELLTSIDEVIFFKVVDFKLIRQNIKRSILSKFSKIIGQNLCIKIENEALEKILSGIWLGQTTLDTWSEKALVPTIHQIKTRYPSLPAHLSEGKLVARLELDQESESRNHGDWLPGRISVVADAQ
ncbi:protein SUPPRESSOR OF MAX2 1-like [Amaranthus tricolor]|uniref:protein SUPPRESSOR OF MAX2 1-like n=1 Tax=Amaranthus tricolor TaxID=29722 RepID=UPI0025904F21|nr:protein SUPPRESSOR OF MAX2 1-like [Amaranthus tricolor]XP_057545551.1 protein SUPPRESSOR OF MAX2 1-like [Amaranthus tricolor]